MVELARRGTVTGVEPAPASLEVARARASAPVVPGSLDEPLPFDDVAFDLAVALDVLEHVRDDRAALRELARVVRAGRAAARDRAAVRLAVGRARRALAPPPPLHAPAAARPRRRRGAGRRAADLVQRRAAAPIAAARLVSAAPARPAGIGSRAHAAGRRERRAGARDRRRGGGIGRGRDLPAGVSLLAVFRRSGDGGGPTRLSAPAMRKVKLDPSARSIPAPAHPTPRTQTRTAIGEVPSNA